MSGDRTTEIAEMVGRMHVAKITGKMLAAESGYCAPYVSEVFNGRPAPDETFERLNDALTRLEAKQAAQKEQE